jgi:hypothetical protein
MKKNTEVVEETDEKAPPEKNESLPYCSKAFDAETSRLEDEDNPCQTAEN